MTSLFACFSLWLGQPGIYLPSPALMPIFTVRLLDAKIFSLWFGLPGTHLPSPAFTPVFIVRLFDLASFSLWFGPLSPALTLVCTFMISSNKFFLISERLPAGLTYINQEIEPKHVTLK